LNCVLIIPAWKPEEIFSKKTLGSQVNYWQPVGTLYVASAMRKAGHTVRFLDGSFLDEQQILEQVASIEPDFAGIYATTFGWEKARKTASQLKALFPGLFIVVGGPFPIALQDKCLQDCPEIDAAVTGEGEISVVKMLERLESGQDLSDIDGVIFRKNGEIHKNRPRALISNLDEIPFPARDLLGDRRFYLPPPATFKKKPVAVILTSRGCTRKCLFCFQIDRERKNGVRFRSVENVMAEIELCLEQGYKEIKFIDDTFAADYDRAMSIATEIISRKLKFTWFASACVNQVRKPLLQAFKKAGCWAILLGAESGVQKNLNTIRKGITLAQTREAVKLAKKAGLKVFTPFIFGIPGETYEDGLQTIKFACEINPDIANFHALTAFPGTDLYDNLEKYGTISGDFSDFTYQGGAFIPYSLTKNELMHLRQLAFKTFYSRPGFLLKRLLKLRDFSDIKAAFWGLKSLINIWLATDPLQNRDPGQRGESWKTESL